MEEERKIINIKIDKEEELYNKFDSSMQTLSDEVISYLGDKINNIPIYEKICIQIEAKKNIDIENFENVFKAYLINKLEEKNKDIKFNNVKKVWLFIIGVAFILASFACTNVFESSLIKEILFLIGSFSIWEMADLMILGNKGIKIEKLNLRRELNSEIKLKSMEKNK